MYSRLRIVDYPITYAVKYSILFTLKLFLYILFSTLLCTIFRYQRALRDKIISLHLLLYTIIFQIIGNSTYQNVFDIDLLYPNIYFNKTIWFAAGIRTSSNAVKFAYMNGLCVKGECIFGINVSRFINISERGWIILKHRPDSAIKEQLKALRKGLSLGLIFSSNESIEDVVDVINLKTRSWLEGSMKSSLIKLSKECGKEFALFSLCVKHCSKITATILCSAKDNEIVTGHFLHSTEPQHGYCLLGFFVTWAELNGFKYIDVQNNSNYHIKFGTTPISFENFRKELLKAKSYLNITYSSNHNNEINTFLTSTIKEKSQSEKLKSLPYFTIKKAFFEMAWDNSIKEAVLSNKVSFEYILLFNILIKLATVEQKNWIMNTNFSIISNDIETIKQNLSNLSSILQFNLLKELEEIESKLDIKSNKVDSSLMKHVIKRVNRIKNTSDLGLEEYKKLFNSADLASGNY